MLRQRSLPPAAAFTPTLNVRLINNGGHWNPPVILRRTLSPVLHYQCIIPMSGQTDQANKTSANSETTRSSDRTTPDQDRTNIKSTDPRLYLFPRKSSQRPLQQSRTTKVSFKSIEDLRLRNRSLWACVHTARRFNKGILADIETAKLELERALQEAVRGPALHMPATVLTDFETDCRG